MPDFVIEQVLDEKDDPNYYKVGETQLNKFIKKNDQLDTESGSSAFIPEDEKNDIQLNLAIRILENLFSNI